MFCAWERCWRGGPGGKELRIRAELLVLLLCPCFQPGIFLCDTPRCSQPLGMGFEQPSPETPWVYCLVAGPSRGTGFSFQNGPGEDKNKNKNLQELGWDLGCFHLLVPRSWQHSVVPPLSSWHIFPRETSRPAPGGQGEAHGQHRLLPEVSEHLAG